MKGNLTIICDPLLSGYGPARPAILIGIELARLGYDVQTLSPMIAEKVRENLESNRISAIDLGKKALFKDESLEWFKAWITEAFFSINSKNLVSLNGVVLNFSNVVAVKSHVWYAQGPPTVTLDNIRFFLPMRYRFIYENLAFLLRYADKRLTKRIAAISDKVVANSSYLRKIYRKMEVNVREVIYPPLNCEEFKPTTSNPSQNFVLTYIGKETKFSVLKAIADAGVKIKAFGSRLKLMTSSFCNNPNIEILGRVNDKDLINLYSNALYTLYPFSDEPFGYIPLESMACGTPVLTYNRQGPSESIIQDDTGWLVYNDNEIMQLAIKIWKKGYPSDIRRKCIERASFFDLKKIAKQWIKLMPVG